MDERININYRKLFIMLLDKRMSQADLYRLSGVSTASISRLRDGKSGNIELLFKICKALDCSLDDIMEVSWSDTEGKSKNKSVKGGSEKDDYKNL